MITQGAMEKDLFALLSQMIVENDDDTRFRFQAQEEALNELKCTQPQLGEWIDRCDFSFLMDTLKLDQVIFAEEFPGVGLPIAEREQFAETLSSHSEACAHCHLKKSYDLQWELCVDSALTENKEAIEKALGFAAGKK